MTITSYNLKSSAPAAYSALDWSKITTQTFGGFIIELADATEYRTFAEFASHLKAAQLDSKWLASDRSVSIRYRSGEEELAVLFATDVPQATVHFPILPGTQQRAIQDRRVNGNRPYLASGLERDTSWSQQGVTGKLVKNGVTLESEPGRKAYLIADRAAAGVIAYNPLPDPTIWQLTLPDGASIIPDGKVGLLRVAIDREADTVEIDHAARDERQSQDLARLVSLFGFGPRTQVRVNGVDVDGFRTFDPRSGKSLITVDLPPPS